MAVKKIQQYKVDAVAALKENLEGKSSYIFTDYRGLTVSQITELRGQLRDTGAELKVVKNNYAKIAFRDAGVEGVDDFLVGPTAVAFIEDEAGPATKALLGFEKDSPFEVKGGSVDGNLFDKKQVEAFSKLPTKIELYAKLMGTMNAPLQNMVYAMNAVTEKLVRTLAAVAEKKENE